jgi:serine/threonine protein kinase
MEHLFHNDVGELLWLVSLLTENLNRYVDFSLGTAHPTTWYYLSSIVPIFLLFPESTLRLCDCITRAGVSRAALDVVATRLPGKVGQHVQAHINKFYLVPCLAEDRGRERFIDDYKKRTLEGWLKLERRNLSPREEVLSSRDSSTETRIANRWIKVYDLLARYWEVEHSGRVAGLPSSARRDLLVAPESTEMPSPSGEVITQSPLALAEDVCAQLSALARALEPPDKGRIAEDSEKSDKISALRTRIDGSTYQWLLEPIRTITYKILDHWQSFYRGQVPGEGSKIEGYILGKCIGEGGYGRVYIANPGNGAGALVVAKIFRHIYDPEGKKRAQFLLGADRNKRLSDGPDTLGLVRVLKVIDKPHPLYTMLRCDDDLEQWARKNGMSADKRLRYAVSAAAQLGAGLRTAHGHKITHGDIKARNILVRRTLRDVHFELADFDMAYEESDLSIEQAWPVHPASDRQRVHRRAANRADRDVEALARVIYEVFLQPPIKSGSPRFDEEGMDAACEHLMEITIDDIDGLQALIAALLSVLNVDRARPLPGDFLDAITRVDLESAIDMPESAVTTRRPPGFIDDQLFLFCETVVRAGIERSSLLDKIPPEITGALIDIPSPTEQILADVTYLNAWRSSVDPHPMKIWLKNAKLLSVEPEDKEIFTIALKRFPVSKEDIVPRKLHR